MEVFVVRLQRDGLLEFARAVINQNGVLARIQNVKISLPVSRRSHRLLQRLSRRRLFDGVNWTLVEVEDENFPARLFHHKNVVGIIHGNGGRSGKGLASPQLPLPLPEGIKNQNQPLLRIEDLHPSGPIRRHIQREAYFILLFVADNQPQFPLRPEEENPLGLAVADPEVASTVGMEGDRLFQVRGEARKFVAPLRRRLAPSRNREEQAAEKAEKPPDYVL